MDARAIVSKAVLLSVFLHLVLAAGVTLSVTAKKQTPSPELAFLGTILQKHDLNTAGHLGLGSDTAATFVAMPQLKPHSPVKETMHSMEKPYFIHDIGGAPKRIIRHKNYIADEIRPEASLEPASNQITEAPYRPLNMEE